MMENKDITKNLLRGIEVTKENVTYSETYVTIDDYKIKLCDIYNVFQELKDCNVVFKTMSIYPIELRNILENKGVIITNIRGGSYPNKNFKNFYKIIQNILDEQ